MPGPFSVSTGATVKIEVLRVVGRFTIHLDDQLMYQWMTAEPPAVPLTIFLASPPHHLTFTVKKESESYDVQLKLSIVESGVEQLMSAFQLQSDHQNAEGITICLEKKD